MPHYRFQSLEVHILPAKTQAFATMGETALMGRLSFCGSRQEEGPPPTPSFLFRGAVFCPLEGSLEPKPCTKLWWPSLSSGRLTLFVPAWFLAAAAGGHAAAGLPAAASADAAATAAAPPVPAAPRPPNHPAGAARPPPAAAHSR